MSHVEGKEERSEKMDKKKKELVELKQQFQTYITSSSTRIWKWKWLIHSSVREVLCKVTMTYTDPSESFLTAIFTEKIVYSYAVAISKTERSHIPFTQLSHGNNVQNCSIIP